MRWRWSVCLLFVVVPAARSEEPKSPVGQIELNDGDTLVFLGDSITHQCLYTQYVEDYFYTRYPTRRIHFHNSGVGGDRCSDALARFQDDVAKFKPKYVTVLLGMNDGGYQAFNKDIFETYERDMLKVLDEIKGTGATAILMTPTMYDARASRAITKTRVAAKAKGKSEAEINVAVAAALNNAEPRARYYNSTLAYYGSLLREIAVENGLGFVDMYGPLNSLSLAQRKQSPNFTLIKDAVHPDAPGQVVMAVAILDDLIAAKRQVFNVTIETGTGSEPKATANGAKITAAETDGEQVAFSLTADSLPWVLPKDAAEGYKLTKAGHRHSRESIQVLGLKPGQYDLRIDGNVVGSYDAKALARGIELQENDKTPQHQQALAVAELNKKRNDEAYRPIRNLWVGKKFQRYAEAAAKNNPDDKNAAKKAEEGAKRLEKFDEQVAGLLTKAKEYEDKIYETNRPKEHRYEIVPHK